MYESPNRTVKTLRAIEEAYNERHQVFIALELTKMNETHYRGEVSKVRSEIEAKIEGSRLKGEVTIVVAPGADEELENAKAVKGSGFDPVRDSQLDINVIKTAKILNSEVEMSDKEFRKLLKKIFPDMPGFHIDALVAIAKEKERPTKLVDRITKLTGSLI